MAARTRPISVGVPSGTLKMTLWYGTEDEETFSIRSTKRGTPYVMAYGVKYELTPEEIRLMRQLSGAATDAYGSLRRNRV